MDWKAPSKRNDPVVKERHTRLPDKNAPMAHQPLFAVDSSTIVALMQTQSARSVQTFTVGFDEAGFDESPHALAVAQHLGTQHHELRVTALDARSVIPALPELYDEPFSDSAQIPTYFLCRAARRDATASRSAASSSASASVSLLNGFVKPCRATSDNRKYWSFLHNTLSEANFPAPGGCTQLGQAGTIDPLPIALELWRKSRSHPR
jgi:hypothetical protein